MIQSFARISNTPTLIPFGNARVAVTAPRVAG
jgi:hypothetical protein